MSTKPDIGVPIAENINVNNIGAEDSESDSDEDEQPDQPRNVEEQKGTEMTLDEVFRQIDILEHKMKQKRQEKPINLAEMFPQLNLKEKQRNVNEEEETGDVVHVNEEEETGDVVHVNEDDVNISDSERERKLWDAAILREIEMLVREIIEKKEVNGQDETLNATEMFPEQPDEQEEGITDINEDENSLCDTNKRKNFRDAVILQYIEMLACSIMRVPLERETFLRLHGKAEQPNMEKIDDLTYVNEDDVCYESESIDFEYEDPFKYFPLDEEDEVSTRKNENKDSETKIETVTNETSTDKMNPVDEREKTVEANSQAAGTEIEVTENNKADTANKSAEVQSETAGNSMEVIPQVDEEFNKMENTECYPNPPLRRSPRNLNRLPVNYKETDEYEDDEYFLTRPIRSVAVNNKDSVKEVSGPSMEVIPPVAKKFNNINVNTEKKKNSKPPLRRSPRNVDRPPVNYKETEENTDDEYSVMSNKKKNKKHSLKPKLRKNTGTVPVKSKHNIEDTPKEQNKASKRSKEVVPSERSNNMFDVEMGNEDYRPPLRRVRLSRAMKQWFLDVEEFSDEEENYTRPPLRTSSQKIKRVSANKVPQPFQRVTRSMTSGLRKTNTYGAGTRTGHQPGY